MSKKLLLILAMALSAALIAAGCGDDDSTTSTSAESTSAETTTEDTGDVTSTEAITDADPAAVEAACKQAIEAQGVPISEDVKAEIEQICEETSASGDPEELQAASQRVCELVVEDNLPEGSAREQALKACETAGQ